MKTLILFAAILLSGAGALAAPCSFPTPPVEDKDVRFEWSCERGEHVIRRGYSKKTGVLVSESITLNGRPVVERRWMDTGEPTLEISFQYAANSTYTVSDYNLRDNNRILTSKKQYRRTPQDAEPVLLREWFYDAKEKYLTISDWYNPGTSAVKRREYYKPDGSLELRMVFFYKEEGLLKDKPYAFNTYNSDGVLIQTYDMTKSFELEEVYKKMGLDVEEVANYVELYNKPNKVLFGLFDSGIDFNHPEIAYKVWKNPNEVYDGLDNDGNGVVDDVMGFHGTEGMSLPSETVEIPSREKPFSHGTHVGSIAMEGLDNVAVVTFAGLPSDQAYFDHVKSTVLKHHIRFMNMSIGVGTDTPGAGGPRDRSTKKTGPRLYDLLQNLIKDTPETLYVVAAGNGIFGGNSVDIDSGMFRLFPASFTYDNILVVGALDSATLEESKLHTYKKAKFSNTGSQNVDVLAPGVNVWGADFGGGRVEMSGTSMATPYTLNHAVLRTALINPQLTILQIKEIVMKTAYLPNFEEPFPVRSGGIIYPERAWRAARLMLEHPQWTVEEAAIAARLEHPYTPPGERKDENYIINLQTFWHTREI